MLSVVAYYYEGFVGSCSLPGTLWGSEWGLHNDRQSGLTTSGNFSWSAAKRTHLLVRICLLRIVISRHLVIASNVPLRRRQALAPNANPSGGFVSYKSSLYATMKHPGKPVSDLANNASCTFFPGDNMSILPSFSCSPWKVSHHRRVLHYYLLKFPIQSIRQNTQSGIQLQWVFTELCMFYSPVLLSTLSLEGSTCTVSRVSIPRCGHEACFLRYLAYNLVSGRLRVHRIFNKDAYRNTAIY